MLCDLAGGTGGLQVGCPGGTGLRTKGRAWLVYWDGWCWVGLEMGSPGKKKIPKVFQHKAAKKFLSAASWETNTKRWQGE